MNLPAIETALGPVVQANGSVAQVAGLATTPLYPGPSSRSTPVAPNVSACFRAEDARVDPLVASAVVVARRLAIDPAVESIAASLGPEPSAPAALLGARFETLAGRVTRRGVVVQGARNSMARRPGGVAPVGRRSGRGRQSESETDQRRRRRAWTPERRQLESPEPAHTGPEAVRRSRSRGALAGVNSRHRGVRRATDPPIHGNAKIV